MAGTIKEEAIKLQQNIEAVYDAGKKAEWSEFWDNFQDFGKRDNYVYAFYRSGWNDNNFLPKYDICPTSMEQMFRSSTVRDLVGCLARAGVKLDTSKTVNFTYSFASSQIQELPVIDTTSATVLDGTFSFMSECPTIQKVILKENGTQTFSSTFASNSGLKNITFEGVIGRTVSLYASPLTTASMKNVIEHLANYAGTSNASVYSVKFSSTCWAALDAEGATSPNGNTWRTYVTEDLGWNI